MTQSVASVFRDEKFVRGEDGKVVFRACICDCGQEFKQWLLRSDWLEKMDSPFGRGFLTLCHVTTDGVWLNKACLACMRAYRNGGRE